MKTFRLFTTTGAMALLFAMTLIALRPALANPADFSCAIGHDGRDL